MQNWSIWVRGAFAFCLYAHGYLYFPLSCFKKCRWEGSRGGVEPIPSVGRIESKTHSLLAGTRFIFSQSIFKCNWASHYDGVLKKYICLLLLCSAKAFPGLSASFSSSVIHASAKTWKIMGRGARCPWLCNERHHHEQEGMQSLMRHLVDLPYSTAERKCGSWLCGNPAAKISFTGLLMNTFRKNPPDCLWQAVHRMALGSTVVLPSLPIWHVLLLFWLVVSRPTRWGSGGFSLLLLSGLHLQDSTSWQAFLQETTTGKCIL